MAKLPEQICKKIIAMENRDLTLPQTLSERGELENCGYHLRLEKLHLSNAAELEKIIEKYGFPNLKNSDQMVLTAAWRIVQHAISNPRFMLKCNELFKEYAFDEIPLKERAYLSDRIAFYQRRPQRYGTQFDYNQNGEMAVWWLEEPENVDSLRLQAGLPPLATVAEKFKAYPRKSADEAREMAAMQERWLVATGWCSEQDIKNYYEFHAEKRQQG